MRVTTYSRSSVTVDPTAQTTAFGVMLLPDHGAEKDVEVVGSDIHDYIDQLAEVRAQSLDDDLVRRQDDLLPTIPPMGGYKLSPSVRVSTEPEEGCTNAPDQLWDDFEAGYINTQVLHCELEDAMDCDPPHYATVPVPATYNLGPSISSQVIPTEPLVIAKLTVEDMWERISKTAQKWLDDMFPHASVSSRVAAWQEINHTYVQDPERNMPHFVELEGVTEEAELWPERHYCRVVVDGVQCLAVYKNYDECQDHMEMHYLGCYLCPGVCDKLWYHSFAELMKHIEDTECKAYSRQQEGAGFQVARTRRWQRSPVPLAARPLGDRYSTPAAPAPTKRARSAHRPRRR